MPQLTISDYVLAGIVFMFLLARVMKMLGWDRGVLIADELRDALQDARALIAGVRAGQGEMNVGKASEAVAARIKGASAADVRPIVESLVTRAADNRYGVDIKLDTEGNVSVDPAGLTAKLAHKAGKWFKKVF